MDKYTLTLYVHITPYYIQKLYLSLFTYLLSSIHFLLSLLFTNIKKNDALSNKDDNIEK